MTKFAYLILWVIFCYTKFNNYKVFIKDLKFDFASLQNLSYPRNDGGGAHV